MKLNRRSLFSILTILLIGFTIISCEKEDEEEETVFPATDLGPVEVNRVRLIFSTEFNNIKTVEDTAEIYDPDGMGGNAPIILDSLIIRRVNSANAAQFYVGDIQLLNGESDVTSTVRSNDEDFIVCYRSFNTDELNLRLRDKDSDGITLGLGTEWNTKVANTSGRGIIRVTVNYQPLRKNGLCDAGIRKFDYNIPYRLK